MVSCRVAIWYSPRAPVARQPPPPFACCLRCPGGASRRAASSSSRWPHAHLLLHASSREIPYVGALPAPEFRPLFLCQSQLEALLALASFCTIIRQKVNHVLVHECCCHANLQLGGDISEERKGRFASPSSLPQICGALEKAAYDPRVCGVYIKVRTCAGCSTSGPGHSTQLELKSASLLPSDCGRSFKLLP